jgi:hypothetical protein
VITNIQFSKPGFSGEGVCVCTILNEMTPA